jgi:hypothetical protein
MGNNFTYQTTPSSVIPTEPFTLVITDEFNLVNPVYGYILKLGTETTLYLFTSSTSNSVTFEDLTYSTFGSNIPFILYEDPNPTGTNTLSADAYQLYLNNVEYTGLLDINPVCFVKGTKILCLVEDKEIYINIEDIKQDTLVKTYLHGYKKIKKLINLKFVNSQFNGKNILCGIYKIDKLKDNNLIEDLYVSGQHSSLVDSLTTEQIKNIITIWSQLLKIDDKFLLMAFADERFESVHNNKEYELYQIILEHPDKSGRYGIYANGLLSETMSLNTFNRKKKGRY